LPQFRKHRRAVLADACRRQAAVAAVTTLKRASTAASRQAASAAASAEPSANVSAAFPVAMSILRLLLRE